MAIILHFLSGKSLSSLLFSSLSWGYFVSSFCLILYACFHVLYISPMSHSLERVALCSKCSVGPSGTIPPGLQSLVLQWYPLCGFFCCGWATVAVSMLVHRVVPQATWLQGPAATAMGMLWPGWPPKSGSCFGEVPVLVRPLVGQAGASPLEEELLWRGTGAG